MLSTVFTSELFWVALKWMAILIIWLIITLGIFYDGKQLRFFLKNTTKPFDINNIIGNLYYRNIQILFLFLLFIIILSVHDIRSNYIAKNTILPPAVNLLIQPTNTLPIQLGKNLIIPKDNITIPFSNITEFNEQNSKEQMYIDWLKERYEAWLISYFYLKKCKSINEQDIDIIMKSLDIELIKVRADSKVKNNIITAATGSYNEMYNTIPCNESSLTSTLKAYNVNLQNLKKY
jgi:hypothetical protein